MGKNPSTTFRAAFEHAPIAVARCNPQGVIVEMNPAFERTLDRGVASRRWLRLGELVRPQDRRKNGVAAARTPSIADVRASASKPEVRAMGKPARKPDRMARYPAGAGEAIDALLMAERAHDAVPAEESLIQTQRWEAIGRLTGGVAHDFNNLLTGVMLYCDLLLASLDSRDCRRRYADEIRSAIMQASGLVQQLLVFARPRSTQVHTSQPERSCRTKAMHGLLTRLIGENIALEVLLDPELGGVKMDQAQAQQILLNLVLNARDALPGSGRTSR